MGQPVLLPSRFNAFSLLPKTCLKAKLKACGSFASGAELMSVNSGANQRGVMVERRAITPTEDEINSNPRAKSAKMRVFERQSRLGGRR